MHPALAPFETAYVRAEHLLPLLSDYANHYDFLARLVKSGDLIRLKNGFFAIAEKIKQNPVPYPQIANLLYGPSYVSFEWALSYYNMIPEGVYVVTSATLLRKQTFETPLGTFAYFPLSRAKYVPYIALMRNQAGGFLMATPEKALCDLVHLKSKRLSPQDLLIDLLEARRMDETTLRALNKQHIKEIAKTYRSTALKYLIKALELL